MQEKYYKKNWIKEMCEDCQKYRDLALALRDALYANLKEKEKILSKGIEYREQELKNIEFQRNSIKVICGRLLK